MPNFWRNLFSTKPKEKDPVCGMMVDPQTAKEKMVYRGKTYYFCSDHCQKQFAENPAQFVQ